jgi:ATP-dependent Clp protease ATP-binding subunit ClpX
MRAVLAQVLPNDVLHFGMIPELVGRLPIICPLMPLDRDAMISILTEPKNAVIRQYQYLFTLEGAQLEFSRDALELIADRALARETGARALRAVIDEIMVPHMYHLPEMQNRDAVYSLTADAIERKLPLTQFVRHVGKESA